LSARPPELLLTCEHGGNRVPAPYRALFSGKARLLASHRGYDIGALECARHLARFLGAPLHFATVTRLLVDLNRSPGHRARFSALTRSLDAAERARIETRYYTPYRDKIRRRIAGYLRGGGRVVHVSVHSFAPVLDGHERNADIGLLYDPRRAFERRTAGAIQDALHRLDPALRVRRNYPYAGRADGLTTSLRRQFAAPRYAGLELEINQRLCARHPPARQRTWRILGAALASARR